VVSLLAPTDPIFSLCQTVVGGDSIQSPALTGNKACQSPHALRLVKVILDGDLRSVHLNFGINDETVIHKMKGVGTGFVVVPQSGGFSVLQAFQFGTGADKPNRDPITITIEGSQFNTNKELQMGASWNLIYDGWTDINNTNDPGRNVYGNLQTIIQPCPYKAYPVLISSQRGVENSVQYSEVRFFGYFLN
jgi:hypothetical protein